MAMEYTSMPMEHPAHQMWKRGPFGRQHDFENILEQGGIAEEDGGAGGDAARCVDESIQGFPCGKVVLGRRGGRFLEKQNAGRGGIEGQLSLERAELVEHGEGDGTALQFPYGILQRPRGFFSAADDETFAFA